MSTVRIPADIDQEDKLLAGLTGRQLLLLAIPILLLWVAYMVTRTFLPFIIFAPIAAIFGGAMGTMVVVKRDGLSLDRLGVAAVRHMRSPQQRVTVQSDFVSTRQLGALNLPVESVSIDGTIDLGSEGQAVICRARAINLSLQTEDEQQALVASFGRFCNSVRDHIQFVTRSEAADLSVAADRIEKAASDLPAVGLEIAARDYAQFLRTLGSRYDVISRSSYVVFRDHGRTGQLRGRINEAVSALAPAGIELEPLGGAAVVAVLQRAAAPSGPTRPLDSFAEIVKGKNETIS